MAAPVLANELTEQHAQEILRLENDELKKLRGVYEQARKELLAKLSDTNVETFTAQQLRSVMVQVDAGLKSIVQGLDEQGADSAAALLSQSIDQTLAEIGFYEATFRGAATQRIRTAAVRRLIEPKALLLQRRRASIEAYASSLRAEVQDRLAVHMVQNSSWRNMALDIAGKLDANAIQGARWRAERIVRTEMIEVLNAGHLATLQEAAEELPGLAHQWDSTLDSRTSSICQTLNGRVREIGKPFGMSRGRPVLRPPALPNCRSRIIPWHADWADVDPSVVPGDTPKAVVGKHTTGPPPKTKTQAKAELDDAAKGLISQYAAGASQKAVDTAAVVDAATALYRLQGLSGDTLKNAVAKELAQAADDGTKAFHAALAKANGKYSAAKAKLVESYKKPSPPDLTEIDEAAKAVAKLESTVTGESEELLAAKLVANAKAEGKEAADAVLVSLKEQATAYKSHYETAILSGNSEAAENAAQAWKAAKTQQAKLALQEPDLPPSVVKGLDKQFDEIAATAKAHKVEYDKAAKLDADAEELAPKLANLVTEDDEADLYQHAIAALKSDPDVFNAALKKIDAPDDGGVLLYENAKEIAQQKADELVTATKNAHSANAMTAETVESVIDTLDEVYDALGFAPGHAKATAQNIIDDVAEEKAALAKAFKAQQESLDEIAAKHTAAQQAADAEGHWFLTPPEPDLVERTLFDVAPSFDAIQVGDGSVGQALYVLRTKNFSALAKEWAPGKNPSNLRNKARAILKAAIDASVDLPDLTDSQLSKIAEKVALAYPKKQVPDELAKIAAKLGLDATPGEADDIAAAIAKVDEWVEQNDATAVLEGSTSATPPDDVLAAAKLLNNSSEADLDPHIPVWHDSESIWEHANAVESLANDVVPPAPQVPAGPVLPDVMPEPKMLVKTLDELEPSFYAISVGEESITHAIKLLETSNFAKLAKQYAPGKNPSNLRNKARKILQKALDDVAVPGMSQGGYDTLLNQLALAYPKKQWPEALDDFAAKIGATKAKAPDFDAEAVYAKLYQYLSEGPSQKAEAADYLKGFSEHQIAKAIEGTDLDGFSPPALKAAILKDAGPEAVDLDVPIPVAPKAPAAAKVVHKPYPEKQTGAPKKITLPDGVEANQFKGAQGSNPGGWYKTADGDEWYVKFPQSTGQVGAEVTSADLAWAMGLRTKAYQAWQPDPKHVAIASKKEAFTDLSGSQIAGWKSREELADQFVHAAWTRNWDAAGLSFDNMVQTPSGELMVVDYGGSLLWRAMGALKGDGMPEVVDELTTLRDATKNAQTAKAFSSLTDEDIASSVMRALADVDDSTIDAAVTAGNFSTKDAEVIRAGLKARRDWLVEWADKVLGGGKAKPKTPDEIHKHLIGKLPNDADAAIAWKGSGEGKDRYAKALEGDVESLAKLGRRLWAGTPNMEANRDLSLRFLLSAWQKDQARVTAELKDWDSMADVLSALKSKGTGLSSVQRLEKEIARIEKVRKAAEAKAAAEAAEKAAKAAAELEKKKAAYAKALKRYETELAKFERGERKTRPKKPKPIFEATMPKARHWTSHPTAAAWKKEAKEAAQRAGVSYDEAYKTMRSFTGSSYRAMRAAQKGKDYDGNPVNDPSMKRRMDNLQKLFEEMPGFNIGEGKYLTRKEAWKDSKSKTDFWKMLDHAVQSGEPLPPWGALSSSSTNPGMWSGALQYRFFGRVTGVSVANVSASGAGEAEVMMSGRQRLIVRKWWKEGDTTIVEVEEYH